MQSRGFALKYFAYAPETKYATQVSSPSKPKKPLEWV